MSTEEAVNEPQSKPAGYDPVDISDLPEERQKEIGDRFNYFYKQIKDMERKTRESDRAIRDWQESAAKQIHELPSVCGRLLYAPHQTWL